MGSGKRNLIGKMIAKSISTSTAGIKDQLDTTIEKSGDMIVEYGAGIISNEITGVVDNIKENTAPIIAERASQISKEGKDSWSLIRETIAPEGGFFKTVFARLVWIGAKISSFVGALFVDSWTGRNETEKNHPNIELIISDFMSKLFKKNDEEKDEKKKLKFRNSAWMPKSWTVTTA